MHLRAILNEAVANALKHAQASEVRVHASVADETLLVAITDNGTGQLSNTAAQGTSGGLGLRGMHARALGMGWELRTGPCSAPDVGFAVTLRMPIDSASPEATHQRNDQVPHHHQQTHGG